MAEISAAVVKELREKTGAGMMDCKRALGETGGDIQKATDYLRTKGLADASKKSSRVAAEGAVASYIHGGGKMGVLIEVNCETDFVAKTEEFQELCRDLGMHICASNPLCVKEDEIDAAVVEKEREIYTAKAKEMGKPDNMISKIVDGQVKKFIEGSVLLSQPFVKNPDLTVSQYLAEKVAKIGENIQVRRFTRFMLGEGIEKKAALSFADEVKMQMENANK
ncbi:MAG: translation elongation factor Ts [Deferribacteraceae bacterium]|jgi:elongation factor Ts|nr:translation elongation factor Ts [Deferribacteraceae bacterium]